MIAALGVALYTPGSRWGLPTTKSWSQDTIAGTRTLGAVAAWSGEWSGRYPPLHYLLLRATYEPILRSWERSGASTVDPRTGALNFREPHPPKIGVLVFVARIVSLIMAVATGWGLCAATRLLTEDEAAAVVAPAVFMIGAAFAYFAHLGNVDVPSMCWAAWAVYFYVRLVRSRRWTDALWLGLLGSLAISTKDSVAGVFPGMAVVLLVMEVRYHRRTLPMAEAVTRAILQWKWLIGLLAFAAPYLWLYGAFSHPDAYLARMRYWVDPAPETLHAQQHRYPDQARLLLATVRYAAGAVGWPMLFAMAASIVYALRRHARITVIILIPAISYYLIVIVPIEFVYSRFLFPPLALLSILVGITGVGLWRHAAWPRALRYALIGAVLLPSLGYVVAIDAELITDSRYEAEAWFLENVPRSASVGASSDPQYLPRLGDMGYPSYRVEMSPEAFERPQPDYLVLSSYDYIDYDEQRRSCLHALLRGELGYEPIVEFRGRYLGTRSSWLSLAGWGAPVPGKISPTITVMRCKAFEPVANETPPPTGSRP